MTRSTHARIAGAAYLLYIAAAFPASLLDARALSGPTTAAKLATLVQHLPAARLEIILGFVSSLCAFALAISLNGFTREEDRDIARFGMLCRFAEGLIGFPVTTLTMLWLVGGGAAAVGDWSNGMGAWLEQASRWQYNYGAWIFSLGSSAFCFLLLRGRMIPRWLAWLGFLGSLILVVELPLRMIGLVAKPWSDIVWAPVAVFEIVVAVWFLYTGGVRAATTA